MAATKAILKLTYNDANVKVTAASADSATIGVDSDLKLSSDDTSGSNWDVRIDKILWSVSPVTGAYLTITRNGVEIARLFGTGEFNLSAVGIVEDLQSDKDLVVAFVGSGGSCYLKLKKVNGYGG